MVFPREGFQRVEILTVLSAFSQIPVETLRARQKEFGIEERRWPIPVALKGEDALKFKQISRGARGGSVAENVFAKVSLKFGQIQSGVVAELGDGKGLGQGKQCANGHWAVGRRGP